ncbi:MAG TPA: serine/threonine-protein kinase [Gaiellales bacterium]|jgi:serine/threonine-protein kinase
MGSPRTEGSAPAEAEPAARRSRRAEDDRRIGLVLDDRYLLVERVGAGGMGVVYRAEHRYTGEVVAIKLLVGDVRGGATWDEIRRRFLKEPHLLALARHPNVPRVIDAGVAAGQPYIVTEYVDGEDLQQRLDARGALAVDETLAILQQAADALDAAHGRGIVHRDVKPANVLIRTDGHVFLTDFGVAKDKGWSAGTVLFIGTTYYAAPEQITLDGVVDRRADIYALGGVMFHCLTGRPPFQGSSPYEVMNNHVREPAPAASIARPSLPAAVDDVIARALAKHAADRYSTCAELVAEAAAATDVELGAVFVPPPDPAKRAPARDGGVPAATYPYATPPPTVPRRVTPVHHRSPGRRRRRLVATALLSLAIAGLLDGVVAADLGPDGSSGTTSGHTATHGKRGAPAPAASGFTGYAARLASTFPDQISSENCAVEPDADYPEALVLIRCSTYGGQIDAYYELWPSQATMNRLLDDNGGGLGVYFAGTWTNADGVPQGRMDRFVTGLLDPRNVILWSYTALNATIWAQSTMSQDRLLAWWRTTASRVASQRQV